MNFETAQKTSFDPRTLARAILATFPHSYHHFSPFKHKSSSLLSMPYQLGGFFFRSERSRYTLKGAKKYSGYVLMTLKHT